MAGWFDFVNGQTLPASRVQDYLMDQSVMTFADAAARTAALPSPTNGMVTYLLSTGELYVRTSTAWRTVVDSVNQATVLPTRRNAIINGAFDIWQRGDTFNAINGGSFFADRFHIGAKDAGITLNVSKQTFTPGTAPVAGYEGQFYARFANTAFTAGNTYYIGTKVEDVRTFAGQTVTFSYWARVASGTLIPSRVFLNQQFGSGGSAEVDNIGAATPTYTTTWTRFTQTISVPAVTGKTIGTGSNVYVLWQITPNANVTLEIWGVQLEAGSVATPFVRAGGTLQGELAACQRYYQRFTADNGVLIGGHGGSVTGTIGQATIPLPVTMRANPTSIDFANISWYNYGNGVLYNSGSFVLQAGQTNYPLVRYTHGSSVFTAGQVGVFSSNATGGFLGFSAEL